MRAFDAKLPQQQPAVLGVIGHANRPLDPAAASETDAVVPQHPVALGKDRLREQWLSPPRAHAPVDHDDGLPGPPQLVLDLEAVDRRQLHIRLRRPHSEIPCHTGKRSRACGEEVPALPQGPQPDGYAVVACNAPYSIRSVCMSRQKPQPLIWQPRARSVIAILEGRGWPEGMRQQGSCLLRGVLLRYADGSRKSAS